jgi:hypothetical protein
VNARVGTALFFAAALVGMVALALGAKLNHDEHQFVASAALLAREGLLPYRDFPYFHTPNLVGIYALLFQLTDHLLLAARLFSTVCAWLAGLVLFGFAWRRSSSLAFALGVAALFLTNPVVVYTFPKAWNNFPPVLLLLLAFVSQCRGARTAHVGWFFASGLFVAFAAGTRISFAPLALPFLVMAWFTPGKWRAVAAALAGMFLASIPVFFFLAITPGEFLFDNLVYNGRVNAAYRLASGDERSALAAKAFFVAKTLVNPGNLALFAAGLFTLWQAARRYRSDYAVALLLAILPFVLLGVFAPTPSYTQYYSVLAAVLALAVAIGLKPRPIWPLAAAVGLSLIASLVQHFTMLTRFASGKWTPLQLHAKGRAVPAEAGPGRILTLAPIVALEGGSEIYGAFATGSFAWRTAPYLSEEDRRRHGFVAPPDLPALLAAHPPAGILLGYDKEREEALLNYAETHGYRRVKLPDKINLWLPPAAVPGNSSP